MPGVKYPQLPANVAKGKAVGLDGVAMEAFMCGGSRVHVHLCVLFNLFVKYG